MQAFSKHVGGYLRWRCWFPLEDAPNIWIIIDGTFSDAWMPEEVINDELADYDAGRFAHHGEPLRVAWTDVAESKRLREVHLDGG